MSLIPHPSGGTRRAILRCNIITNNTNENYNMKANYYIRQMRGKDTPKSIKKVLYIYFAIYIILNAT